MKLSFSGHETFQCRNLWPKKGFDFIHQENGDIHSEEAVLSLGVGKNMTTAIRFWMDAFGFLREKKSPISFKVGQKLLSDGGWDPYLEDLGSLWLLHFELVKNEYATIYNLVFNHFRKYRAEFTKKHLLAFIKSKILEKGKLPADSTLEADIGVFLKTYVQPSSIDYKKNIEDHFSALLLELNLIKEFEVIEQNEDKKQTWYKFEHSNPETLPIEIFLYSILVNKRFSSSIAFQELLNSENSPGSVFLLNPDSLAVKIEELTQMNNRIVYTEDAGVRQLQIPEDIDPIEVLTEYYRKANCTQ